MFPSAGSWRYEVQDGYVDAVHSFPPVEIAGDGGSTAAAAPDDGGGIAGGWLIGAAGALVLALAAFALDRRRRHGGAPPAGMKALALGLAAAAAAMVVLAFATAAAAIPAAATGRRARARAASTPADPGFAVWREQGCGGCHTLAAAGATGNDRSRPRLGAQGRPARDIERDIVAPGATAAAGYAAGAMPEDYAARIDAGELDALVAFLAANARR